MICRADVPSQEDFQNGCPPAARETLHMLGLVLKAAFRMHCTGETTCGQGPWQLVQAVQQKLLELSQEPETLLSHERLARYVEACLSGQSDAASPG